MPARGDTKSVGGKSYQWNGRRWVPARGPAAPADPNKPQRSDFGGGRSGAKQYQEATREYRSGTSVTPAATPTPAAPSQASGRAEPAPDGSGASGTRTGPAPMTMDDANKILQRGGLKGKGYTVQNPFTSTQLPATSANPYFEENPETNFNRTLEEDMFQDEEGLRLTRNAFDANSGVEYSAETLQRPATGAIEEAQLRGAPLTVSSGTFQASPTNESAQQPEINKIPPRPRGGRQLENWERQYGRMTQPVEREKSDLEKGYKPDKARRDAFLDTEMNSMEALRAVEAQKGIVFTGNTYNIVNPNAGEEGQNDFMQIDKAQRDTIMRGGEGAQNLLDSYVKGINESDEEDDNK